MGHVSSKSLVKFLRWNLSYNTVLLFKLLSYGARNKQVNKAFFHRLTFKGYSVPQVLGEYLKDIREEVNAVKDLRSSIKAPAEQL